MGEDPPIGRLPDGLAVRRVPGRGLGGRGVFATRGHRAGAVLELAPVILVPAVQVVSGPGRRPGRLAQYVFAWDGPARRPMVAVGLGWASLYNHALDANARWACEPPDLLRITAAIDIAAGAEVTLNYFGEPGAVGEVGFEVRA